MWPQTCQHRTKNRGGDLTFPVELKLRHAARIRAAHRQKPRQAYSTRITHKKITVIQTLEDKVLGC